MKKLYIILFLLVFSGVSAWSGYNYQRWVNDQNYSINIHSPTPWIADTFESSNCVVEFVEASSDTVTFKLVQMQNNACILILHKPTLSAN